MPIYEVTEVGSGGGGCLVTAVVLFAGAFFLAMLADSCASPSGKTERASTRQETTETEPGGPEDALPPSDLDLGGGQAGRADIRQRFVNGWVLQRLLEERGPMAVVAVPEAASLEESLVGALRRRGVSAHGDVFTPEAYQSGKLIRHLESGDDIVLKDLLLTRLAGHLVLGRLTFSEMQEWREGYRTRASLSVTLVPLSGGRPSERTFEARGSGFEAAEARAQATGRVQSDFLRSSLADQLTRR